MCSSSGSVVWWRSAYFRVQQSLNHSLSSDQNMITTWISQFSLPIYILLYNFLCLSEVEIQFPWKLISNQIFGLFLANINHKTWYFAKWKQVWDHFGKMKHVMIQESMSRLSAETVLSRIECKHRPSSTIWYLPRWNQCSTLCHSLLCWSAVSGVWWWWSVWSTAILDTYILRFYSIFPFIHCFDIQIIQGLNP